MLIGCGGPGFALIPIALVALFVAANVPIALGAFTAALFRRGLDVPALNKVSRMNMIVGSTLFVPALFIPPLAVPAVVLVVLAALTASLNRPKRAPSTQL